MKKTITVLLLLLFPLTASIAAQKRKTKVRKKKPAAAKKQTVYPMAKRVLIVKPGTFNWSSFVVPGNGGVFGRFEAAGGSGNNIELYIVDADGLTNLRNGNTANTFYNSGRKTVESFDVSLPGGQYYFVFSNTFSLVSNKAVTFNFSVRVN